MRAGSGCEVERRGLAEVVVASRGFWTGTEPCPVGEMMRWRETLGNVTGGVSWMVGWPHAASAPTVVPRSCTRPINLGQVKATTYLATGNAVDNKSGIKPMLCTWHRENGVVVNGAAFANANGRFLQGDRRTAAQACPSELA